MSWSKVRKCNLPLGWWFRKFLCEFGYYIRNKSVFGWDIYYHNLNELCKYGYNIYGDKIK